MIKSRLHPLCLEPREQEPPPQFEDEVLVRRMVAQRLRKPDFPAKDSEKPSAPGADKNRFLRARGPEEDPGKPGLLERRTRIKTLRKGTTLTLDLGETLRCPLGPAPAEQMSVLDVTRAPSARDPLGNSVAASSSRPTPGKEQL
ncbi:serine/threonine-protein phosphatase 2A 65 kDa regulatory subunit A beta isoform isoform X1 [Prionailurus iriomotensis]